MEEKSVPRPRSVIPRLARFVALGVLLFVAAACFSGGDLDASELAVMPDDCVVVFVVDVDELLDSEIAESLQDSFRKEWEELLAMMEKETGMGPEDYSQFALGMTADESDPLIVIRFSRSLEEEERDRFLASLHVREPQVNEVAGHRYWSSSPRGPAMGELRGDTFVCGTGSTVEAALRRYDAGQVSPLVEKLLDEDGPEQPVCAAFDWRKIPRPEGRTFREFRAVLGAFTNHLGPVVMTAELDDDARMRVRAFDPEGEVVARYDAMVKGEFLRAMIAEAAKANRRGPRADAVRALR